MHGQVPATSCCPHLAVGIVMAQTVGTLAFSFDTLSEMGPKHRVTMICYIPCLSGGIRQTGTGLRRGVTEEATNGQHWNGQTQITRASDGPQRELGG